MVGEPSRQLPASPGRHLTGCRQHYCLLFWTQAIPGPLSSFRTLPTTLPVPPPPPIIRAPGNAKLPESPVLPSTMSLHLSHDLRLFHYAHATVPLSCRGGRAVFFEAVQLQGQLTHQLLQFTVLPLELLYLLPGRITHTAPSQPLLPSFHEPLGPGVVGVGFDSFPSAQVINGSLPSEPLQDDADLLFRGVLTAGRCTDLTHEASCLLASLLSLTGLILYLGHQ